MEAREGIRYISLFYGVALTDCTGIGPAIAGRVSSSRVNGLTPNPLLQQP